MLNINNPRISQPICGRWYLEKEIGRGRHGIVYLAHDAEGYRAAVKIISLPNEEIMETARDNYGNDAARIENFVGEIAQKFGIEVETMRSLGGISENIIKLYDNRAQQHGIYWDIVLVMEYAVPMKNYFCAGRLSIEDIIDFAMDIASGLSVCERRHVIHRDIKEDNLFIGTDTGRGKIGDFGVANINENGLGSTVGMGTPWYMAPEVTANKYYDSRVDIYSLGIVLYKMLNGGRFPFVSGNAGGNELNEAYERRRRGEQLPFPQYADTELGRIVLKCCEYDPDKRFARAEDLYEELARIKQILSPEELAREVPYPGYHEPTRRRVITTDTPVIPVDVEDAPEKKGKKKKGGSDTETDIGMKTVDIIRNLTATAASWFRGLIWKVDDEMREKQMQEYKKKQKRIIIAAVSLCLAILTAILIILYPKCATFYVNEADNDSIHVKYLFLPDMRKIDMPAAYLNVEDGMMYYSNPRDEYKLYKVSIWGGDPELVCADQCHYDIVIDDYVYYTKYDDGEKLYRIRTDGTDKSIVIEYCCRDLKRNGRNLEFRLMDTGEYMSFDTSTYNDEEE